MARVDLGWRDGKRRYKTLYGRSRRAVATALRDALRDADQGTLVADARQTVREFLARWLSDVARTRVRPRTLAGYAATVEHHITPELGRIRLAKLTPQHLQAWLATLEAQGVSVGRRRYARVILRNAMNTAVRWRLVQLNVATLIDAPRTISREIQPLTPEQARGLLLASRTHPLEAFVTVALGCGLRLGEALGLLWTDVDLDAGTVQVRRAVQRFGGDAAARRPLLAERKRLKAALQALNLERRRLRALETAEPAGTETTRGELTRALAEVRNALAAVRSQVHVTELKSARSRRTIALPQVAVVALRAHRVRQLEARLAAGGRWQEHGLIFTSAVGTALEPRNLHRSFKALLRTAGLPNIRIHDLRHSCATLLLAQGVNPRVVMETLGHSQVSLTLNTYSHVLPALQRDAAVRMNAVLSDS
jgi:integrase